MPPTIYTCEACAAPFSVSDDDADFLERISPAFAGTKYTIPSPRRCPACREQLRMAWRNEKYLFARACDHTGERLISMYPPGTPFPVYRHREWFKDHNDTSRFGRAYDPARSIFAQMSELQRQVPRFHVFNFQEELDINSQYTNCAGKNKNCYLMFASGYNEQCMYGRYTNHCFDCVDMLFAESCRGCYESSDLGNCERVFYSVQCKDCHDSYFLSDCRGCHDCTACAGLRRKSYCIFNEQFSPAAYADRLKGLALDSRAGLDDLRAKFDTFRRAMPQPHMHGEMNEHSTGDYLWNTKDCRSCFDTRNAQDCAYCTFFIDGRDSMDVYSWGEMELCYQISGGGSFGEYHSAFTAKSFGCKECYYLDHCVFCDHCFACVGLNRASYCVLNRRYAKDEYEALVSRVIGDMTRRREWGEFLPGALSPFGYNYSAAADYYPLERSDALARGFNWSEYQAPPPQPKRVTTASDLPERCAETSEDILEAAVSCLETEKLFRITRSEYDFYRKNAVPLPVLHPDAREKHRMSRRNPRRLWNRPCDACGTLMTTSYAPGRPERVLCERCYREALYS